MPSRDDLLDQLIQLRCAVLLVGMLAQPAHGFASTQPEGRVVAELRHEAFDLRVVKHARMGLVAFERAGRLRGHLADEIRRDLVKTSRLYL